KKKKKKKKKEQMGNKSKTAAADKVTRTTTICSVPYAMDESASEDNNASAANLLNLCSSFSADFNGFPMNSRFKSAIFFYSFSLE
ncbi:hypothetical protein HMPREF9510_02381, partial [Enterococcus faecalis TX0470]